MKTWQYHAENVHNFAFTADPTYRIGEVLWKGVRCIALAQEPNAWGWQQSAYFTAQVIRIYSEDFGMYDWPKIIVADAKDGMEYPMITLDGGTYPRHQSLLAHEVGHMWFYGHNVILGRCCVIVAQVGISGSTVLEDFVRVGGQAAMAGHLRVGQGAEIGAQSGLISDVARGARVLGSPAQPKREFFRQIAMLRKIARGEKG